MKNAFAASLFLFLFQFQVSAQDPRSAETALRLRFKEPGVFYLSYEFPLKADLHLVIAADNGQSLYEEQHPDFEGRYERILDMRELRNGIYFVRMSSGKTHTIKKVVVQK